jgi:hypothetical protein
MLQNLIIVANLKEHAPYHTRPSVYSPLIIISFIEPYFSLHALNPVVVCMEAVTTTVPIK